MNTSDIIATCCILTIITASVWGTMPDNRPGWDDYYLGIAKAVSMRGECTRRQIGAILVNRHNRHKASGYNGGFSKGPSCLKGECPRGLSDVPLGSSYDTGAGVCIALHAEQNLVAEASPEDLHGGKIYITDIPCDGCLRTLKGTGVVEIIWPDGMWMRISDREWVVTKRTKPLPKRAKKPKKAKPVEKKTKTVVIHATPIGVEFDAYFPPAPKATKRSRRWTPGSSISVEHDPL